VTDALSKGTIDGTTIPWEVTPALKVSELVKNHTTFAGKQGLYTQTFAFSMNRGAYDKLPADLKKVIDDNSGMNIAPRIGQAWEDVEQPGRDAAKARGNKIVTMDVAEVAKLRAQAQSVNAEWVEEMKKAGKDGAKLLSEAEALIGKHAK
jgi:TRAP-type C4-dicarboxylate transport system substrate-binding protein